MRWIVFLGVTACYAPRAPEGAPCGPQDACPTGLVCRGGACLSAGADNDAAPSEVLPVDAIDAAAIDTDGDGVYDGDDNCPTVKNADQYNEDNDHYGDACDPCPVVMDTVPPQDPDHDGVSAECDLRPQTPGDSIVFFEGFAGGVPNWPHQGSLTSVGDEVRFAMPMGGYLTVPGPVVTNGAMFASITVETVAAEAEIGLRVPYLPMNNQGIGCELYHFDQAPNQIFLYDYIANAEMSSNDYPWPINTALPVGIVRSGANYLCRVVDPSVVVHDTASTTQSTLQNGTNAIVGYGITVRLDWVIVLGAS